MNSNRSANWRRLAWGIDGRVGVAVNVGVAVAVAVEVGVGVLVGWGVAVGRGVKVAVGVGDGVVGRGVGLKVAVSVIVAAGIAFSGRCHRLIAHKLSGKISNSDQYLREIDCWGIRFTCLMIDSPSIIK